MTDIEKMALKLAIDTMERNLRKYCDRVMFNDKKGIRVGYGEAIGVLENMLKESELCIAKYNNGWIPCSEQMPKVAENLDDEDCPEFNVTIAGAMKSTTLKCDARIGNSIDNPELLEVGE